MAQTNPVIVGQAIQYQLDSVVTPVPVYAAFNRNYATQPKFVTWMLRNVHQPVYTGQTQSNKGIDTPIFQISVFTQKIEDGFTVSNQIMQAMHGYSGMFGNPASGGFFVAKLDLSWLYNTYNNEENLAQVVIDATMYIPN
jgi:hypothetical protein